MATNSPSKFGMVAGLGVAVLALILLNMLGQRMDPAMQKKLEEERQAAAARAQQTNQAANPETASPQAAATPSGGDYIRGTRLVADGAEAVYGKKDGKQEIVIGYEWTPAVQGSPQNIIAAVETVQKAAPDARIRVVNVDQNPDVAPGVSIGGRVLATAGEDGLITLSEPTLQYALAISKRDAPNAAPSAPPGPGAAATPAAASPAAPPPAAASPAPR